MFSPDELTRIRKAVELMRSFPRRMPKAKAKEAMAQIPEEDHKLLIDWMVYRFTGKRKAGNPEAGITKPSGFVWKQNRKAS